MPIHPTLGLKQSGNPCVIAFHVNVTLGITLDIFIVMILHCISVFQSHLFQLVVLNMGVFGECLSVHHVAFSKGECHEEHQITLPPCP